MDPQPGTAADLQRVLERMPHQPPMRLLSSVEEAGPASIVCLARIDESHLLLDARREVSAVVAIELFAQAAAAWMVYRFSGHEGEPMGGYLLGTRRLEFMTDRFVLGDVLRVEVEQVWGTGPLSQFDGVLLRAGEIVAKGSVNVARA